MRKSTTNKSVVVAIAAGILGVTSAYGQFGFGGGGANWNTAGLSAERTSWVPTDRYISKDSISGGDFQLQWKLKVENPAGQKGSILGATSSGGGLSKPLNVIQTSSNTLVTVDNDTGIQGWVRHFNAPASSATAACPAGMTANGSRAVPLAAPSAPAARAGNAGAPRTPVGYTSVLGEPGQGLPPSVIIRSFRPPTGGGPAAAAAGAATPAPGLTAAPPAAAAGAQGGGQGRGGFGTPPTYKSYFANGRFGSNSGFFVLTSDGMLRTIADGNGVEMKAPVQFLPANAHASDLTVIPENNAAWHAYVVYTSTTNNCGGVPNRVWALNLASDDKAITHFDTGASPIGDLAFSEQGTVFVALGKGSAGATYSNAVVALEPKTLTPKAWFTDSSADFVSTPAVIKDGAKEIVAEVSKDGRIFLLDAANPGGSDHKTALFVSPAYSTGKTGYSPAGIASWQDEAGVTYIAEPFAGPGPSGAAANGRVTNGGIVTLKLTDDGGKVSLTPVWVSQDFSSPPVPVVVNGVMFAASGGQKSEPGALYALDAADGKQIWSSGKTITSSISAPLWAQGSQVYVATSDDNVYAFGPSQGRYVVAKH